VTGAGRALDADGESHDRPDLLLARVQFASLGLARSGPRSVFLLEEPMNERYLFNREELRDSLAHKRGGVERLAHKLQSATLRSSTSHMYRRIDRSGRPVVAISAPAKEFFSRWIRPEHIEVVPHGIDLAHYEEPVPGLNRGAPIDVGVFGNFEQARVWEPVLELLTSSVGHSDPQTRALRWLVCGSNPAAELRALAGPRVNITGTVADTRSYYQATPIVVVSENRRVFGTKTTALEAWASGCALVVTPECATSLPVCDGVNALVASGTDEILAAIRRLHVDPALRSSISAAGRQAVRQHNLASVAERFADIAAQH
jgi:glycosyltransferase involved in cell wall biosynthesis